MLRKFADGAGHTDYTAGSVSRRLVHCKTDRLNPNIINNNNTSQSAIVDTHSENNSASFMELNPDPPPPL